jgi:hypothetical protein
MAARSHSPSLCCSHRADYGLSGGEVYRVEADSERGNSLSFVVKREGAQAVERALRFHRAVGLQVVGQFQLA